MITIDSLLDLVKSETYQKQVISPVALPFENDNEGWYHNVQRTSGSFPLNQSNLNLGQDFI